MQYKGKKSPKALTKHNKMYLLQTHTIIINFVHSSFKEFPEFGGVIYRNLLV
jgi:hypothetical protein